VRGTGIARELEPCPKLEERFVSELGSIHDRILNDDSYRTRAAHEIAVRR
jgi:hypothetical protein